jgi:RNA polymerase sigma-54 factor
MCAFGSGFSQNLSQRQSQNMVLAPQLRHSLKILQVAALDLRQTIAEELQTNPVLEELPMDGVSIEQVDSDGAPDGVDQREEMKFDNEFEVLAKMGEDFSDSIGNGGESEAFNPEAADRRQHFFDSLTSESTLLEHLMEQAQLADISDDVRAGIRYIVGSLDNKGFLSSPFTEIVEASGMPPETMFEAKRYLNYFDPIGIGAQDLKECLLIQLTAKGRGTCVAARIIRDHFPLLVRRRLPDISRKIGLPVEAIQEAIEEIGRLDPSPGSRFAEDTNRVVVPDVTVEKVGNEWQIILNNDYIPRVRLSRSYRELIAKGTLSEQERSYLREKLRAGKFLINSIEQRQQTIEKITREILRVQIDFFEEGVSKLKPLTMTQVADVVGVHETTVSRALANKFIRTPHGVFEMKYFFTPGYQSDAGESISNTSVKDKIKALLEEEDPAKPLSDEDIGGILKAKGIPIARRTVAKYRGELGILPSNLRRRF